VKPFLNERLEESSSRAPAPPSSCATPPVDLADASCAQETPAPARKQRIALVGHLAGAQLYGAQRSLLALLAAIDRTRYDVSCALPRSNDEYLRAVRQHTDDVAVFSYPWWSRMRPSNPATVSRFARFFRLRRVDLVHVNTITLMDPLLAAREIGVPCIVHARELIDQNAALAGILGDDPAAIVSRVRTAADFIIANSDATHRLYYKERRSFRLYNSIDTDAFDVANEVAPGRLRIGIISNNHPDKGIEHFVKLAMLAAPRRLALEFVVVGPRTAHAEHLARRAQREGVPVNLRFAGYVADPVEAVRQVNVVVSFSIVAESFGRTLVEAMAARRPVIAYGHGAAPELLRHGIDGFIVPPFDVAQALAHLETLVDDPARVAAMGEAGRARAEELFAPAVFASSLDDIYRRILTTWDAAAQ
jgi:glycosyltransferase involved in cell wall biosynthesis